MFGLSFLNSLFLWGTVAATIPLIIHLIKRNRAIKLPFAAVRFLQLEPNQKVKSQRLKQLLLLLMRMMALALLAFAFARPFFKGADAGSIWGAQPKAAVILVDNSFSMGYDNLLRTATEKAQEVVASFNPGDQVAVMQFSEKAEIVAQTDKDFSSLAYQLNQLLTLSNRSTNYMPAIQTAEAFLLDSPFESKEIYLISDFQKTGWNNVYPDWKIQPEIRLHFVNIGKKNVSNVAVKEVHLSEQSKTNRNKNVLVRVKNYGSQKKKSALTLHIQKRKVALKNVTLLPEEEKIVQLNKVHFAKGLVSGFVEVQTEKEDLTTDNRYFFVVDSKTKAQILAVNGEPNPHDITKDELFFVDRAVNLPKLAKYILIQTVTEKLHDVDFHDYQAVILGNVKTSGRETLKRLLYYVRAGGGLILALGDQVNPTIFNQLFRDLSPASITSPAFNSINRENSVILAAADYQHPIFRIFSDAGQGDPSTAQFYQYFNTEPVNSGMVLASFDDGSPAILERKIGAGKVILFTSSFDTEWNNLPVKAIFLPLLYQTLQYVASEKRGQKSYLIGQPVAVPNFAVEQMRKKRLTVQLPSGDKIELKNTIFEQTEEPGIYRIQRKNQNRQLASFAVNIDSKESDLTALAPEDLQTKFLADSEQEVQTASMSSPKLNEQQERQQKLWRLAILGVILLLLAETWLANRTYR